jgi:CheY-like chemotaxis protein
MQEKHGMVVNVDADENAEPTAEQIRQFLFDAVRELLLNVVKYAQVNHANVRMRMLQNGKVEITVSDNGIGFDPLKLENTASTVGGFGLFSIRERLSYLRGHMEIDSAPAQGSRFTLMVPVSLASPIPDTDLMDAEVPAGDAPHREGIASAGSRISILLADDHPVLRHGLTKVLEEQPDLHVVGEVGDGQAAVKMARELKPDVVLMDVSLPLLNGFDATRQIVAELPGTRVIGLSMHEEPDMAATMFKAGASAYLTKGGPIERLIGVIRSCRSEKRSFQLAGSTR